MEVIVTAKPTILIYHHKGVTPDSIKELLYGIEEEGIPYTLEERSDEDSLILADLASHASALSVGVSCTKDLVVLSFKNLPPELFMYKLRDYRHKPNSLRVLGTNAARLVKGNPFKKDAQLEVSF